MKHIAFFLSARDIDKKYTKPALELVQLCVQNGYGFVYGGSDVGLMKQAADEVHRLQGKIIGISSQEFAHVLRAKLDESYVAATIFERKKIILEKSDAIVALPGGSGTLDEITDIIEHKKIGAHEKPIIFLNTDGFWDGLLKQYDRMFAERFLSVAPKDLFYASDDLKEIMQYLKMNL